MRRIASGLVAALAILALTPAVSAAWDPFAYASPATTPVYEELDPLCAELLAELRAEGHLGDHSGHRGFGYEDDPWKKRAPACAELRDEVQWEQDAYGALPYHQTCNYLHGTNCVAVNHYACDMAVLLASGLIYLCMGGFTPKN